ncbi:MAG: hypothetical protein HOP30_21265 [Cyclobacteriaceae bacterium]|nr:hypothetical protein [Cyclobacteriaceae bacterium]
MSTSDSPTKFILRAMVANEYKYLVSIFLFDSTNRIISPIEKSRDQYKYQLKKGLYTLRVEMNAGITDKVITVNTNKAYWITSDLSQAPLSDIIQPPQQFSSALLSGARTETYLSSHEYYTHPAIKLSKRNTFIYNQVQTKKLNSSLFIFLRFPSIDKYNSLRSKWAKSFYKYFEIVNEYGELLLSFDSKSGLQVNENDGWLAFNAQLPHGIYYLIYRGSEPRQIPIYVFNNWHTQFFMTLGEVPLFGTTRIFMSAKREFNPKAEANKYIDILLDKLQNGDYSVDEELIEIAAYGKYRSPMLGLICSYVYFKSRQTKSDDLFRIITQNMQRVILKDNDESPDLRALSILAAEHFDKTNYRKTAIKGTPMLRIGLEAIKNASLKNRALIPKNSINDFISETLYYDSPFNTFKPIPVYKRPKSSLASEKNMNEIAFDIHSESRFLIDMNEGGVEKEPKELEPKIDKFSLNINGYLEPNLISFIKSSETNSEAERNWVRTSISGLLSKNENLSINDISNQLNLSGNTITRIFDDWGKKIKIEKKKKGR